VSEDDIRYEAKDLEGHDMETVDDGTDDEVLEAEGRRDQATANVNHTGKAEVRDVRDGVREAYESGS